MFLKTRQHANGLSHVDQNSLAYKTIVTYGDDTFAYHFDCHLRHVREIASSSLGVYRDQG